MIGAAMGLAARGAIPFPSTFACFLTRAADFIRMAAISNVGIKMAGSHAGVSIGEDGPSQMALEDLAMCRARAEHHRAVPVRRRQRGAPRGAGGVPPGRRLHPHQPAEDARHLRQRRTVRRRRIEGPQAERRGSRHDRRRGCHRVRSPEGPRRAEGRRDRGAGHRSVFAAARRSRRPRRGRSRHAAGASSPSKITTRRAASATPWRRLSPVRGITVTRLAVREIPRSGKPDELLDRYGISSRHIVDAVRKLA